MYECWTKQFLRPFSKNHNNLKLVLKPKFTSGDAHTIVNVLVARMIANAAHKIVMLDNIISPVRKLYWQKKMSKFSFHVEILFTISIYTSVYQ